MKSLKLLGPVTAFMLLTLGAGCTQTSPPSDVSTPSASAPQTSEPTQNTPANSGTTAGTTSVDTITSTLVAGGASEQAAAKDEEANAESAKDLSAFSNLNSTYDTSNF